MNKKICVILGVGPQLGRSVAIKFAHEGYDIGLMARNIEKCQQIESEIKNKYKQIKVLSLSTDSADEVSIRNSFQKIRENLGHPEVLVFNVGRFIRAGILDIKTQDFEQAWKSGCMGALISSQEVIPNMKKEGKGTIIFTGATGSLRGSVNFAPFAVTKFGLRALAQSIAREYGPYGIHVGHFIIDGHIGNMNTSKECKNQLSPDSIAESYWQLHCQDKSAWSLEVDLRPCEEKF
jgi:NAD(P)-dependent dehydrogenase (short-subunit alcohol dehydrogenase family)